MNRIFVYGSLKRGYLRENAWPHAPLKIEPAIVQATLYDLGPYPALALSLSSDEYGHSAETCYVLGELWTIAEEDIRETLRILDRVEGYDVLGSDNEYERVTTEVITESGETCFADLYKFVNVSRLSSVRRINSSITLAGFRCASWPDALAKVPKSLDEEWPN